MRRLPEVEFVRGSLRRQVIDVFLEHCPDYFWVKPASSSGNHHPPSHRGRHGLWLHTKRAVTQFEEHARSFEQMGLVNKGEVNYGRAAVLLHDLFKYGEPPAEDHTLYNHDVVAARYFARETDLPDEVISCVNSHNGAWGRGPKPDTSLQVLHHMADNAASFESNDDIAVYKPCQELKEQFPELCEWDPDLSELC